MSEENKLKRVWDGINNTADKINPIFNKSTDLINKATQVGVRSLNKSSEKTSEKLNDVTNHSIGQKKIKCPRCKSLDVSFMKNDRKKFSVGKALGGNLLAGGVGTLAGFAGKEGNKNHWRCNECGTTFKK